MRLVRAIGVIAILTIAFAILLTVTNPKYQAPPPGEKEPPHPGGFQNPILAMELVESKEDAETILKQTEGGGKAIRRSVYLDFGFITSYGALYVALSLLLARRKYAWAAYLARVTGICGVAVAGFDVLENLRILRVIDATGVMPQMASSIHDASAIKWTLGFVTAALLAVVFRGLSQKADWVGYAFTLTAIVGLVGLYYKRLLPLTFIPIVLGLIGLSLVALFWPQDLDPDSCR